MSERLAIYYYPNAVYIYGQIGSDLANTGRLQPRMLTVCGSSSLKAIAVCFRRKAFPHPTVELRATGQPP